MHFRQPDRPAGSPMVKFRTCLAIAVAGLAILSTGSVVTAADRQTLSPVTLKATQSERQKELDQGLIGAASAGLLREAWKLIRQGANVNARDGGGRRPLIEAAMWGHTDVVRFLMESGADLNAKDGYGETALMKAVGGCHGGIVRLLVAGGADVNAEDKAGRTALMKAARTTCCGFYGQRRQELKDSISNITAFLLRKGADVNVQDTAGLTALMYCRFDTTVASILIRRRGIKLDIEDFEGNTALMWAVIKNDYEMVEFLLKKGAEVNASDHEGRTPLERARGRDRRIKSILEEYGGKEW